VLKTVLCKAYTAGFCKWSDACRFAHGQTELRKPTKPLPVFKPSSRKRNNSTGFTNYSEYNENYHPESPPNFVKMIQSLREKIALLEEENVDLRTNNTRLQAQVDILMQTTIGRSASNYSFDEEQDNDSVLRHRLRSGVGKRRGIPNRSRYTGGDKYT